MSVVSIPIVNKNYPMGCEDGQEARLIELGKMVDARAREILDKIGPLQESSLLATLCIVLADEVNSNNKFVDESELKEILVRIRAIKQKIS
ncbi:MAG: cell division protein ZapA [Alphaproteobacteria bacterium]|jgi:cell division protein ZapA|nr:cell division protein ZapA [Alphaproteobacteria bacterium]MBN2675429.1 cell division protein ZapA [Alphaproteobacteria bacterium]